MEHVIATLQGHLALSSVASEEAFGTPAHQRHLFTSHSGRLPMWSFHNLESAVGRVTRRRRVSDLVQMALTLNAANTNEKRAGLGLSSARCSACNVFCDELQTKIESLLPVEIKRIHPLRRTPLDRVRLSCSIQRK